jgi:hypothetical protein
VNFLHRQFHVLWGSDVFVETLFYLLTLINSASTGHRNKVIRRLILPSYLRLPTYLPKQLKKTPWNRIILEKLIVAKLVKKFPAFYGTRLFITMFTTARHWSLSWTRWIQPTVSRPVYLLTSNTVARSRPRLLPKQYVTSANIWSILTLSSHLHLHLPIFSLRCSFIQGRCYLHNCLPLSWHVLDVTN